jgi:hypothetical protein
MRGVLGPAVELWTFGSPGGLQVPNFSKCWASPPHLAKLGLRHIGQLNAIQIFIDKTSLTWKHHERSTFTYWLIECTQSASFMKLFQLEIIIFFYWPIEYNPKASFVKVFQFEKITFIYWSLNAFENLDLCECFNLQELLTSIGQFDAFKEFNLLRCFNLKELPLSIAN